MESEIAVSGMEAIISAMGDSFTLVGTVITEITKQPVLLFLLAAGMIPVGVRIFKMLKGATR